jgi:hypothetical protein
MRTSRIAFLLALLPAALAALVAGCAKNPAGPAQWASDLNAAESRWRVGAVQNYTWGVIRICNCTANQIRPVTVTVRNGVLNRIVYSDSVGGYADTTLFRQYLTMPRYFALLDQVLASGPSYFSATYSPSLGFPTYVQVDPEANVLDEEFTIQTLSFTIDTP